MIKFIGFILIVASTTALGFAYADNFKRRVRELKEVQRAVYILKNEINFTHSLLPDALYKASIKCASPIKDILNRISELLLTNEEDSVYECFKQSFKGYSEKLSLKEEDISIILDLAKTLGETNIEGHNEIFTLTLDSLEKAISKAELNEQKNVKMYRYLGFSFGTMIAIILL